MKRAVIITGPTASGESALAVDVARRLSAEIISADSRQIYHGIPIVTAMPTDEERRAVRHHLVDMLPLDAYYSASQFEHDALDLGRCLMARDGVCVVCGGSMMYVDALCNGIDEIPTVPPEVRTALMTDYMASGDEWLWRRLRELDPVSYGRIDLRNIKRVFHAVEVSLASGRPYSSLLTGERRKRDFRILKFGLSAPREVLFSRINSRVERMVADGLLEEARRVWPMRHLNSLNTVGLKEMFAYIDGSMGFDEAVARIQKNTRVYAKKQLTWFKRDDTMEWLDITEGCLADKITGRI